MGITKTKAFGIHLAISLVIFLILSWFLIFRWFPQDLFFIDGGWQGMRIIAAVDLVLGPMLTLIFYKQGKPGLKFDISMIALVQISALIYGIYAAQQQSVVAIAFVEGRFVTVSKDGLQKGDEEMRQSDQPVQPIEKFNQYTPAQIYVEPPPRENYGAYIASVLNGMPELQERSHAYRPLAEHLTTLTSFKVTSDSIGEHETVFMETAEKYLQQRELSFADRDFFRLKTRYGRGLAVVDPETKSVVDIVRIAES